MDVSNFFSPAAGDSEDEPQIHAAEPAEDDDDTKSMSAVQRIKAFRDGALAFPDIASPGGDHESPDTTLDDDESDDDPGVQSDGGNDSDGAATSGTPSDETSEISGTRAVAWIRKKKVLLGSAAALLTAGIIANVVVPHKHDSPTPQTIAPAAGHHKRPAPTLTATPGDKAIMPIGADVPREACITGSTPPMDAFTDHATDKNKKAWACQTPHGAPGTTMTITLPGAMNTISEISAIPGYDGADQDGKDNWPRYRLVSSVIWYFDDGSSKQQDFTAERKSQTLKFDTPKFTKTVRLSVATTTAAPPAGHSPATTSSAPGLLGDLGDWGKTLGGGDPKTPTAPAGISPAAPVAGAPQPAETTAFAMSGIQIIGHTSR